MKKLGRTAEQRMAMIRTQASELLWNGRLETTVDRAKEVSRFAEKMLTLAINSYEDTRTVQKEKVQKVKDKEEKVVVDVVVDGPVKLAARRAIMANLRDLKPIKNEKESKGDYNARLRAVKHPLVEKLFREYAPFYADRAAKSGQKGGYTRVIKLGQRRGDRDRRAGQVTLSFTSRPVVALGSGGVFFCGERGAASAYTKARRTSFVEANGEVCISAQFYAAGRYLQ